MATVRIAFLWITMLVIQTAHASDTIAGFKLGANLQDEARQVGATCRPAIERGSMRCSLPAQPQRSFGTAVIDSMALQGFDDQLQAITMNYDRVQHESVLAALTPLIPGIQCRAPTVPTATTELFCSSTAGPLAVSMVKGSEAQPRSFLGIYLPGFQERQRREMSAASSVASPRPALLPPPPPPPSPPPPSVPAITVKATLTERIFFAQSATAVDDEMAEKISGIARQILGWQRLEVLTVVAKVASPNTEEIALAKRRAEAIAEVFASRGVPRQRIMVSDGGKGQVDLMDNGSRRYVEIEAVGLRQAR